MEPNKPRQADRSVVVFFVLTLATSWLVTIPAALHSQGLLSFDLLPPSALLISGFTPSLVALILTAATEGATGLRDLLRRLLRWRVPIQWYLFVLGAPAAIILGALWLSARWTGTAFRLPEVHNWPGVLLIFCFMFIFGGPLGEELGWRGYALPKLLRSRNVLTSALIVGVVWGIWHLPLFWIRGSAQDGFPIGWFMGSILAESILYAWMQPHTDRSLLLACLFHGAVNTWAGLLLIPLAIPGSYVIQIACALEMLVSLVVVLLARQKFTAVAPARVEAAP